MDLSFGVIKVLYKGLLALHRDYVGMYCLQGILLRRSEKDRTSHGNNRFGGRRLSF